MIKVVAQLFVLILNAPADDQPPQRLGHFRRKAPVDSPGAHTLDDPAIAPGNGGAGGSLSA